MRDKFSHTDVGKSGARRCSHGSFEGTPSQVSTPATHQSKKRNVGSSSRFTSELTRSDSHLPREARSLVHPCSPRWLCRRSATDGTNGPTQEMARMPATRRSREIPCRLPRRAGRMGVDVSGKSAGGGEGHATGKKMSRIKRMVTGLGLETREQRALWVIKVNCSARRDSPVRCVVPMRRLRPAGKRVPRDDAPVVGGRLS